MKLIIVECWNKLERCDCPQLRVTILPDGDQRCVIQPGKSGYLALGVGIYENIRKTVKMVRILRVRQSSIDQIFRYGIHSQTIQPNVNKYYVYLLG